MPPPRKPKELHTIVDCFSIDPIIYHWLESKTKNRGDKSKVINFAFSKVMTSQELEKELDQSLGATHYETNHIQHSSEVQSDDNLSGL